MDLEEFCLGVHQLDLTQTQMGTCVLWFFDEADSGVKKTPGEISRVLSENGLASPHSTKLGESMVRSKLVQRTGKHLRLKPTARATVRDWLKSVLAPEPPVANQDQGFLPRSVWNGTRQYIENIAGQINSSYEFEVYDGAAVLCRRLIETLLIECYEHLEISAQIKSGSEYLMLRDIINHAVGGGLTLGRDAKKFLPKIKELGDRSAHNRRFNAKQADLDKLESGIRLVAEELIQIAELN